jgi:Rps23 Pro-64 3,4-dihydroxylase Tpa1-like proline 4-hydroxylase
MNHVAGKQVGATGGILIGSSDDHMVIGGVRLDLDRLINRDFLNPDSVDALRCRFQSAKPFPHLVLDHLFDAKLLDLVRDEFDLYPSEGWTFAGRKYEKIHRLLPKPKLGPAAQLYFSIINSGWFIEFLSQVTGVENLIPDPQLYGGGMHETRNGGLFEIHLDFNKHHKTLLANEMVFITYLNKDWQASWNGALELWDADTRSCTAEVLPEFGRTVILLYGLKSLHGHPRPLNAPEGLTRRSVAAYYYTNRQAKQICHEQHGTLFFVDGIARRSDMIRQFIKNILPPVALRSTENAKQTVKRLLPAPVLRAIRRMQAMISSNG